MRATLEALKAGGIEFVVFLSSFTIKGPLDKISPANRIPYAHAQVELNLEATFGPRNRANIRAGAFATNTLRWREDIAAGTVVLETPDMESDLITPTDMGNVAGQLLVDGQKDGQNVLYLYGPELVSQKDALAIIIRAVGKRMEVVDYQEQHRVDEPAGPAASSAERVIVRLGYKGGSSDWAKGVYANHQEGVENVVKHKGGPATSFEEWVKENKGKYRAE